MRRRRRCVVLQSLILYARRWICISRAAGILIESTRLDGTPRALAAAVGGWIWFYNRHG